MKNVKITVLLILMGWCVVLTSCNDHGDQFDSIKQLNEEVAAIDSYISSSFLQAIKDPTGVRMVITKLGTGLPAQASYSVDVDYKGTLFSNGTVFAPQANTKGAVTGYIGGWQIALTSLPEGSEATLFIPSAYGYGNVAKDNIPANSTLVFEIKLKDVIPSTAQLQKLGSDTVAIDKYLQEKSITAVKDPTGIRYVITAPGGGSMPGWYDKLTLKYSFRTLTNDASSIGPYDRQPSDSYYSRAVDYVQGIGIGLQKMPEGSKATLYIPSGLGFGDTDARDSNGTVVIPANTNLIVDIELIDIQ
jgi:FKBP-type peptidyl-prolyl cis-trans isomerase FkpA